MNDIDMENQLDELCDAVDAARAVSAVIHRHSGHDGEHPFDNLALTEDEVNDLQREADEVLIALADAGFLNDRINVDELKRILADEAQQ